MMTLISPIVALSKLSWGLIIVGAVLLIVAYIIKKRS